MYVLISAIRLTLDYILHLEPNNAYLHFGESFPAQCCIDATRLTLDLKCDWPRSKRAPTIEKKLEGMHLDKSRWVRGGMSPTLYRFRAENRRHRNEKK